MGKYSHTGLAYGTQGSPQIPIDENIYSMKITEISNQLQLNLEQSVKSSSRTFATKKHQHKNIMDKIIFLILSMGYEEIIIGNTIMYIKDNIILKISYIKEYEYYILEKTDTVTNAQNNIFELLASISNEIEPNIMLKTIKNILTKLQ